MTRINVEYKKSLWHGTKDTHYYTHYEMHYDMDNKTIWYKQDITTHKTNDTMKKN